MSDDFKNWPKDRQLAALFPMKGGAPNPDFASLERRYPGVSENLALRERGLAPCVWVGTAARLRAAGIAVEHHPEAFVQDGKIPGQTVAGKDWAPRWAVLVCEAEPCNEDAKDQALERAVRDEEFRDALDTISRLAETQARRKMADYLMEFWEPRET